MRIVVSSASGPNGDGYGTILAFDVKGEELGPLCEKDALVDPRGLCVSPPGDLLYANSGDDRVVALDRNGKVLRDTGRLDGADLGGGTFGPDHRYYVGSRHLRTIMAIPAELDGPADAVLAPGIVPFPRGFAFGVDGRLFLASGVGPSGVGEETIKVFEAEGRLVNPRLVDDPQLSPLDLAIAPNGNIVVSSEWPFGAVDADSSVREYDSANGRLVRSFSQIGGSTSTIPGVCDLVQMASSTASGGKRSSPSTSTRGSMSEPRSTFRGCSGRRWSSSTESSCDYAGRPRCRSIAGSIRVH